MRTAIVSAIGVTVCQGRPPGRWSARLPQSLEAVQDDVERELELDVVVAAAERSVVSGRQGHFRDVGEDGGRGLRTTAYGSMTTESKTA